MLRSSDIFLLAIARSREWITPEQCATACTRASRRDGNWLDLDLMEEGILSPDRIAALYRDHERLLTRLDERLCVRGRAWNHAASGLGSGAVTREQAARLLREHLDRTLDGEGLAGFRRALGEIQTAPGDETRTSSREKDLSTRTERASRTPGEPACRPAPGNSTVASGPGPGLQSWVPLREGERAPDLPDPPVAEPSAERYEIRSVLGEGGMGTVYRAWDSELRREVAFKTLLKHRASTEAAERLLREARLVATLHHPGIVPIFDVGILQETPYYTMPVLKGETLTSARRAGRFAGPRDCAEVVRQVAEALGYAHGRGLIHRDIKPANLQIDEFGRVLVLDFGLAKNLDDSAPLTAEGQFLGTLEYMSPEQVECAHDAVGPAADVYALGVVLYEMLTGRLPIEADNKLEFMMRIARDDPPALRRVAPDVPRDLVCICDKALRKTASARYATAVDLEADLARFLRGEAVQARPESRWERGLRWVRRRPAKTALAAVLVIGLGGAAGFDRVGRAAEAVRERHQEAAERASLEKRHALDRARAEFEERAELYLESVAEQRRCGLSASEGADDLARLERAAADLDQRQPGRPEPRLFLARMLRVLDRPEEARRAIEDALHRDPTHRPALYERVLQEFHRILDAARSQEIEAWATAVERLAVETLPDLTTLPPGESGGGEEAVRAGLRPLLGQIPLDFTGSTSGNRSEPAGVWIDALIRIVRGSPQGAGEAWADARARLVAGEAGEESIELLGFLEARAGNRGSALEWYDRALQRDRGHLRLLLGRAGLHLALAGEAARVGDDPGPSLRKAKEDAAAACHRAPESADSARIRILASLLSAVAGIPGADACRSALAEAEADLGRSFADAPASERNRWQALVAAVGRFVERRERALGTPDPSEGK